MLRGLAVLALVLAFAAPGWAVDISYDGSANPATVGWYVYEGSTPPPQPQGSVYDEGGGNSSWHLNDVSGVKTKMSYGNGGVAVDANLGVYLESRVKCVTSNNADAKPLNLGLWITGGVDVRREMSVQPSKLWLDNKSYLGTFSDYHVIRMCYKRLDLKARGMRQNSWAVYVDGASQPVLWTKNSGGAPGTVGGGPVWGAGNTGDSQDLYFDYVNYYDDGAFPPGMDGTVTFVNGDPDGNAVGADSMTISWQTNVPTSGTLYYNKLGDPQFALSANDPDPTLKTSHSVTITGIVMPATYEYYVVSAASGGAKAISVPSEIALNPFNFTVQPSVTQPNANTATITWQTSLPDSSSQVRYGLWPGVVDVAVEPGGGATSHSVTIPTVPGNLYYYYVSSTHPTYGTINSGTLNNADLLQTFTSSLPGDIYLDNIGFEIPDTAANQAKTVGARDLGQWTKFGGFGGVYRMFQNGFLPNLAYCAGSVASSSTGMDMGGLYQNIPTTPGEYYVAQVSIWTRRSEGSNPRDVACRIGVDPAGGTDPGQKDPGTQEWIPNENVAWSAWDEMPKSSMVDFPDNSSSDWKTIDIVFKASGSSATVFLQQLHKYPFIWCITGFDQVSMSVSPWRPPSTISATKSVPDGYPVSLTGKVVTASWFYTSRFYIEEPDRSSGIKVVVPNTIVPPAQDTLATLTGYMRTMPSGEREIYAYEATGSGSGSVGPLGMNNKGSSAANTALLCRVWGRVVEDPDIAGKAYYPSSTTPGAFDYDLYLRDHFYVDDGSGILADYRLFTPDGGATFTNNGRFKGIKVYVEQGDYIPQPGDWVVCTGIAGSETSDPDWNGPSHDVVTLRTLEVRLNESQGSSTAPYDYGDILVWP